jgi:hypothetical protein
MGVYCNARMVYGLAFTSTETEGRESFVTDAGTRFDFIEDETDGGEEFARHPSLRRYGGYGDSTDRGAFGFAADLDVWEVPVMDFTPPRGADRLFANLFPNEKPVWLFVHSRG